MNSMLSVWSSCVIECQFASEAMSTASLGGDRRCESYFLVSGAARGVAGGFAGGFAGRFAGRFAGEGPLYRLVLGIHPPVHSAAMVAHPGVQVQPRLAVRPAVEPVDSAAHLDADAQGSGD